MIDWILMGIGLAISGASGGDRAEAAPAAPVEAAEAPEAAPAFEAEPQTPSGKFTTAAEVKPILSATKASWVAVREYNGEDLLYVTHLLSWRCGMHQVRVAVNGGPMQAWPLPPCLDGTAQPNAIRSEDGLPYRAYALGELEFITVEILYDDLSTDKASFTRSDVLMP